MAAIYLFSEALSPHQVNSRCFCKGPCKKNLTKSPKIPPNTVNAVFLAQNVSKVGGKLKQLTKVCAMHRLGPGYKNHFLFTILIYFPHSTIYYPHIYYPLIYYPHTLTNNEGLRDAPSWPRLQEPVQV